MKQFLIYDSGAEFCDRYTIFYKKSGWEPWQYYIACSDNPFHPQGFGQHGQVMPFFKREEMAHIGKPERFGNLPKNVQKFALMQ